MDSGTFLCNVCGTECARPEAGFDREIEDCSGCRSTPRLRAFVALLSQEIFGVAMTLPEFPKLKGIRVLGMSDSPEISGRLAEKFDYTNTFYHQAPHFDVTSPEEKDLGRYDLILSSEVMEHVPPPVERAFATLFAMLKPAGVLLMTTPYSIEGKTREHFPELHEYALAAPGGRTVLVNRRRDGSLEVFENLAFHGGHGSTLEIRLFSENSLREMLASAGFDSVCFANGDSEFGIERATWSVPIAARKGRFQPPLSELALEYREAARLAARKIRDLAAITSEYDRHIEWGHKIEKDWEDRTTWALKLKADYESALAAFEEIKADLAQINSRRWTRLGRKLGRV